MVVGHHTHTQSIAIFETFAARHVGTERTFLKLIPTQKTHPFSVGPRSSCQFQHTWVFLGPSHTPATAQRRYFPWTLLASITVYSQPNRPPLPVLAKLALGNARYNSNSPIASVSFWTILVCRTIPTTGYICHTKG